MVIAFIGTRAPGDVPIPWLNLFRRAATLVGASGHAVVTGAAPGADQLAAQCALSQGGEVTLVLPWRSYERAWVQRMRNQHVSRVFVGILPESIPTVALQSVKDHHPAFGSLSQGGRRLHARNYLIVHRADLIIALPSDKPGGGGTGQGIRIAEALNIPCVDLSLEGDRKTLPRILAVMRT